LGRLSIWQNSGYTWLSVPIKNLVIPNLRKGLMIPAILAKVRPYQGLLLKENFRPDDIPAAKDPSQGFTPANPCEGLAEPGIAFEREFSSG
jgi:hypothetical protein